ncbi:acetate--CoA ligase family protein [Haladaptatus pallidirubidus]|uniref:acetate--CoA ligase family protein n=1 Tax=Haladaptatus pallidirubidus TaxID=1008152 RepID=UPI0035E8FB3C
MDAVASMTELVASRERRADRPTRAELVKFCNDFDKNLPQGRVLTWAESENLLSMFDVPVVETHRTSNADEAAAAAEALGFPVVLKLDSPALPHRTDIGAVKVGIDSADAARTAFDDIMDTALSNTDRAAIEGVLVQPMIDGGVEAILGVAPDELFGSLVTVGPGGVLVEALDDSEVLVPPFSTADAKEAIAATALGELQNTVVTVLRYRSMPSRTCL